MDGLLVPLQSKSTFQIEEDLLKVTTPESQHPKEHHISVNSPENALEALKSKPDLRLLAKILRWLTIDSHPNHGFSLHRPSSKTVQIIYVLVNDIVPDYWHLLNAKGTSGHPKERRMLVTCLRSAAGIGAVLACLRLLITQLKDPSQTKTPFAARARPMCDLLEMLEAILKSEESILSIWRDIDACIQVSFQKTLQWKELLSLLASGKLLSIASEASILLDDPSLSIEVKSWVGNGVPYSSWLGSNVQFMNKELPSDNIGGRKALSQLFSKALNIGYRGSRVICIFTRWY